MESSNSNDLSQAATLEQPLGFEAKANESAMNNLEASVLRMLENQRRDIMYELRRLRLGDRPVTGQGNKELLEEFFARELNQPSVAGNQAEAIATSGQRRPESVIVEVNALVERRPVSSVLESAPFRQSLEQSLRGIMQRSGASRALLAAANYRSPFQTSNSAQNNSVNSPRQSTPDLSDPVLPPAGERQNQVTSNVQEPVLANWLNNQQQANVMEDLIDQHHQEVIIDEITELLHRHVVSATLAGNFRDVLEHHLGNRVQLEPASGTRVAQFIQSLPRSGVRTRNDFSHLGIGQGIAADNLDNVSIISATAAVTVPYAQSNASLVHEMQLMKTQLLELQTMMRVSFDVQLDLQRTIRQEVAAAIAAVAQGNGVVSASMAQAPRPVDECQCTVCQDRAADTVMYQCGHLCACYSCAVLLKQRDAKCPICRAPIRDIVRAYKST